jgi:DNA-binding transcriptional LysR family regulator
VRTTEAGELLLEEARRIFTLVESTVSMVRRVGHGEVGWLTLGFVPSSSDELLPPILSNFGEKYPDVDLFLREMRPDLIVQRLHGGQIDVGFLYLPLDDPSLEVERVSRKPLVLALPARYRRVPGLYGQVTDACREAGFTPNAVQKDVWLMQTIVGLVAGGIGAALVPASVQNLRRKGVVYKTVHGLSPSVELGMVWRSDDRSAVLRSFLGVTRETQQATNGELAGTARPANTCLAIVERGHRVAQILWYLRAKLQRLTGSRMLER